MAAPTFVQEAETAWNTATTPKTTGSFTTLAGDVLVGFGVAEDTANSTALALTGGSLTWAQQQLINAASSTWVAGWTATASAASITATVTKTQSGGTAKQFGGNVLTFRGSDGVGASAKAGPTSGAPSVTITTTQDNSAVVVFVGDWAALATARTWRTVNSITPTAANGFEVTYSTSSGVYTVYGAYYPDVGLAGAKTVGLTAPTGQTFSIVAIEVKGTAGGGGHTVAVGTATEADAAQSLGKRKIEAVGTASETEAAIALARAHRRTLGVATEVEAAQPIGRRKARAVGMAAEVDAAIGVVASRRHVVGTASETDAAQILGRAHARALGTAAEADVAQPIRRGAHVISVGIALETEAAQPIGHRKTRAVGIAAESDQAQPITRFVAGSQTVVVHTATETASAQPILAAKRRATGVAAETGVAQSIGRRKMRALTAAVEVDAAQTIARVKRRALATAAEADTATVLRPGRGRTVGTATETDAGRPFGKRKVMTVGVASETDAALTIGNPKAGRPARPDGPPGTGRIALITAGAVTPHDGRTGRLEHAPPGSIAHGTGGSLT